MERSHAKLAGFLGVQKGGFLGVWGGSGGVQTRGYFWMGWGAGTAIGVPIADHLPPSAIIGGVGSSLIDVDGTLAKFFL